MVSGITRQTCLCVGKSDWQPVATTADGVAMTTTGTTAGESGGLRLVVANSDRCAERYQGRFIGIDAQWAVDVVHYLSASAVCFARAVNDTPKIAALLLAASVGGVMTTPLVLTLVSVAVVVGGLVQSRKVALTMSKRITDLNPGQGLVANLVTAGLVLGASRFGVPVSTTHVSCGTIFGIGMVNKQRDWKTIAQILTAWLTTLPLGFVLGAIFAWSLQ